MKIFNHFFRFKWYYITALLLFTAAIVFFSLSRYRPGGRYFFLGMKQDIEIPTDKIKKAQLKNGMSVLVFENHAMPKVLVQIAYDIGSSVEQAGERGLAHLIEHMIFKGTDKLSEGDIDAIGRKYGATFNAFTSMDVTSYFFEVDRANWTNFLPILADCMQNARFDSQHFASEVKAVIQELRMRKDHYWDLMIEKANTFLYPANHPYHTPVLGFKEDLVSLSVDRLKDFYKKYYQPQRATLFVVGDVDASQVIQDAREHFESIPAEEKITQPFFPTIISDLTAHRTTIYRDVTNPQLGFYWRIPGRKQGAEVAAEALELGLGWGEDCRLNRRLVDKEKVATGVAVGAHQFMESGIFLVLIQPKEGKIDRCRSIVADEMQKIIKKGFSTPELSKIARIKKASLFETLEDFQSFTYEWITSYFASRNEFDLFEKVNDFNRLTADEIMSFAGTYLDPLIMNEIALLPTPEEKKETLVAARAADDALDLKILASHVRQTPKEKPRYVHAMPPRQALDVSFPKPDREVTLPNGLLVLLHQNKTWPMVTASLQFRNANFLASAKDGIPLELMMSMLIEGSVGFDKKQNITRFEQEGASYSYDKSGAKLTVMREQLSSLLPHFVHVLTKPSFKKEPLDKLKAIEIDCYERLSNEPIKVASRILRNLVYPDHPYYWTFEDAIELLKDIDLKKLQELHETYVAPSSMVLSVVGDFELDEVEDVVTKSFGAWRAKGKPTAMIERKEPQKMAAKSIDYYMLRDQAIVLLGKPSPIDIYHPDLIPLKLLNLICWHSLGSRLFEIREETGLFYAASGAWAANVGRNHGFDHLLALVNVENLDKAESTLRELIDTIRTQGVTQDELEVARALYAKSLIDLRDSNSDMAATFCSLASFDLGFDYYDRVLNRLKEMTLAEVNEIAKKYFSAEGLHRVRVGRIGRRRR